MSIQSGNKVPGQLNVLKNNEGELQNLEQRYWA